LNRFLVIFVYMGCLLFFHQAPQVKESGAEGDRRFSRTTWDNSINLSTFY